MEKLFNFNQKLQFLFLHDTAQKSCPLSIFSVNRTKSADSCANSFFVQYDFYVSYTGVND